MKLGGYLPLTKRQEFVDYAARQQPQDKLFSQKVVIKLEFFVWFWYYKNTYKKTHQHPTAEAVCYMENGQNEFLHTMCRTGER